MPWRDNNFRTVEPALITNPHGYFDLPVTFASSGFVRLAWTHPDGQQIHSRNASIVIR